MAFKQRKQDLKKIYIKLSNIDSQLEYQCFHPYIIRDNIWMDETAREHNIKILSISVIRKLLQHDRVEFPNNEYIKSNLTKLSSLTCTRELGNKTGFLFTKMKIQMEMLNHTTQNAIKTINSNLQILKHFELDMVVYQANVSEVRGDENI